MGCVLIESDVESDSSSRWKGAAKRGDINLCNVGKLRLEGSEKKENEEMY